MKQQGIAPPRDVSESNSIYPRAAEALALLILNLLPANADSKD